MLYSATEYIWNYHATRCTIYITYVGRMYGALYKKIYCESIYILLYVHSIDIIVGRWFKAIVVGIFTMHTYLYLTFRRRNVWLMERKLVSRRKSIKVNKRNTHKMYFTLLRVTWISKFIRQMLLNQIHMLSTFWTSFSLNSKLLVIHQTNKDSKWRQL